MKYLHVYALFLISVFHNSCGRNQTNSPKDNIKSETKDIVTSPESDEGNFHTKYEYTDSAGKRLIIQNSFPRGEPYTDSNGKKYAKAIFWTQIINETANPLDLKIDFPVDAFEVPSLPGKYFKILIPPDAMTLDKFPLFNYGLANKEIHCGNINLKVV